MGQRIFWCKNCLNMSTRPRIQFDERGWCNACTWMEEKKHLDWSKRQNEVRELLKSFSSPERNYDCIVPVSGGKDGSYVSYQLKHKYGAHPLTVTVKPPLSLELGDNNLGNFVQSGYEHLHITPDPKVMKQLNKLGFVEKGFPYYGWLTAILTAVIRTAYNFNIPLIFYGEDGEVEYGGSTETKYKSLFNVEYMKRVYLEAGYEKILAKISSKPQDLYLWKFPTEEEIKQRGLSFTHMSYFEPWDPYRNYLVAKEYCGLQEREDNNVGTFTNFAQNDQAFYALHTYMMYLKFGFGRATQDAGIEIRRGAMTREQAKNLVGMYDNQFPESFMRQYLDYYEMTQKEFDAVLDRWVNKELFEKKKGKWEPVFKIE